jgi:putative NADH-flavin reductase
MRVTVFGATGRVGRHVVVAARTAGHEVTILSRAPELPPGMEMAVVRGDVTDLAAVRSAVRGSEAVISAVGPRHNAEADELALEEGMQNVTQAMAEAGVRRLVVLSGAAVSVPGDRKPAIDRVVSRFVRLAAGHVVGAKQREFAVVAATDLDWTAIRPAIVTDGPARGYVLSLELRPGARTTRADVGQAMVDQLTEETFLRQAPFVLPAPAGPPG